MLPDRDHFSKRGPFDLISWELSVYRLVQRTLGFPVVCELFFDHGPDEGSIILHRVLCFRDIYRNRGKFEGLVGVMMYTLTTHAQICLIHCRRSPVQRSPYVHFSLFVAPCV